MTATDRLMKAIEGFIDAKVAEMTRDRGDDDHNGPSYALDTENARTELRTAFRVFRAAGEA